MRALEDSVVDTRSFEIISNGLEDIPGLSKSFMSVLALELRKRRGPRSELVVRQGAVGALAVPRTVVAQVKILFGGSGGMADDPISHLKDIEEAAQLVRAGRAACCVVAGYQASDGLREVVPVHVTSGET